MGGGADKITQFTEDQISKIPGIDSFPAWFATSLKSMTDPVYFGVAAGYYNLEDDNTLPTFEKVKSDYQARELGHPPGSTTEYIDDLDNKFTRGELSDKKGKILSSDQLKTTSVEDAINLFYKEEFNLASARDFDGRTHSDSPVVIRWGKSDEIFRPQYIWLAKELKNYGYESTDKIFEILTRWIPASSDPEDLVNRHENGFVSPMYLEPDAARREINKIIKAQRKIDSNPRSWTFPVYFCERDLQTIRDTLAAIEDVDIPLVSWLSGGLNFDPGDGYQDCFLVHYTSDPRFLIRRGSGEGAMVYRLKKY